MMSRLLLKRALACSPRQMRAFASEATPPMTSLFSLTEEEEMFREAVRKFATEVVQPKVYAMDEAEKMDPALIKALFDQGLMAIETEEKWGGSGASFTSALLAIEELAKVDPAVSVLVDIHAGLIGTSLRKYATEHVKDKYLPRLASDTIGSFAISEPSSGSDAFALKTTATKSADGSYYTVSGSKMWISNSAEAGLFLVFATVDASKGYKGITCFLVEKEMGVKIGKKEKKLGIRASSTCGVDFDDVIVPTENMIGEEGKGYKLAIEMLNEGRVGIGAQMVGLAQGAFDLAVPYTLQREQFGSPVGLNQSMQMQFATIATEIEAARLLVFNAARMKEEGKSFVKEAAMAKWYASVVAEKASGSAIEWAGGVGFTREMGIEKFWRDSKIGAIYEGTSNIQLQTIAKLITKKYT